MEETKMSFTHKIVGKILGDKTAKNSKFQKHNRMAHKMFDKPFRKLDEEEKEKLYDKSDKDYANEFEE
jgi:hypothetical protein